MLVNILVFTCLFLLVCISLLLIMKQRDRAIYEDLKGRFEMERRRNEASMEFNSYFLYNSLYTDAVTIEFKSKNYILYNDNEGNAVIKEKTEEFSLLEKEFYSYDNPKEGENGN